MTAYDEVPYECQPIPCSAPEQLAMASLFHGGPVPPVWEAHVLEIGCGDGANLLSLAFHRPDGRFAGVDASAVQIADARRSAQQLGLKNTTLHVGDITQLGDALGTFDYIVAHGVMSWVSDDVRDGILAVCRDHLSPRGLLYLSYNTHPGWLARGLVRDVLVRRHGDQPLRRLAQEARRRAGVLRRQMQGIDHPYAQLLSNELARVDHVNESYLIHEYLSHQNRAYWFRDFAGLATRFGFCYLAEAAFTERDYRVPPSVREVAGELETEPLEVEGLIDVLWYRQHRASLFCRHNQAPTEHRDRLPFDRMTVASGMRPKSDPVRLDPGLPQSFTGYFEPEVAIDLSDPLPKAALLALAPHWPRGLSWERLVKDARAVLEDVGIAPSPADNDHELAAQLRELHALGQVELRLREPPPPREPSEPPAAKELTRWEAARREVVTTPTHHRLPLTEADRLIVQMLDGQQLPAIIVRTIADKMRAGEISASPEEGFTASDSEQELTVEQWAERHLDRNVTLFKAWGLLE
jgi:cyclopropane fatty-acyl-phospholipid synthase-like methyltransferase/methyltransferase-like protein